MSADPKVYFSGVSQLLDGIADTVATVVCPHGKHVNDPCWKCDLEELDEQLQGIHDSEAAANEDWGRWPR